MTRKGAAGSRKRRNTEIGRTASGVRAELGNPVPVRALTLGLEYMHGIIRQDERVVRIR